MYANYNTKKKNREDYNLEKFERTSVKVNMEFSYARSVVYKLSCSITWAPLQSLPGFTTTGTSIEAGPVHMKCSLPYFCDKEPGLDK